MKNKQSTRFKEKAVTMLFRPLTGWLDERRFAALKQGKVRIQSATGGDCIGVTTQMVQTPVDLYVAIATIGFTRVVAGDRVREGDEIICDGQGRAISDPCTPGATVWIQGIARSDAVHGQSFQLELRRYKLVHPLHGVQKQDASGPCPAASTPISKS